MFTRLRTISKNSLAIIGLGTTIYGIHEYKEYNNISITKTSTIMKKEEEHKKKKVVLHLPFHKMKIVERKSNYSPFRELFKRSFNHNNNNNDNNNDDTIQEVELQTIIDVIHDAAMDPNVVALYATFGNGFRFQCGGFAHVEEIRNAIRVFNESHRRHYDRKANNYNTTTTATTSSTSTSIMDDSTKPHHEESSSDLTSKSQQLQNDPPHQPQQKFSYAFADTFDHPIDSANKEYFLASAFTHVQMQSRGNLSLFGVSTSNTFLLGALEKYGVKAHVFKHGKYKSK